MATPRISHLPILPISPDRYLVFARRNLLNVITNQLSVIIQRLGGTVDQFNQDPTFQAEVFEDREFARLYES